MFKKILKIIIVMALTFSMSIPLINVYAFEENYERNVMPTRKYENFDENVNENSNNSLARSSQMPVTYSSVDKGYVTSVKNQNPYGNCWAYAACSVAESYLIKHGIADKNIDLSEAHLNYYMYHNQGDNYENTDNDQTNVVGQYSFMNVGADPKMLQLAMSNFGLASESNYPISNIEEMQGSKANQNNTQYVMTNSNLLCQQAKGNEELIKQAILDNGSVLACYYDAAGVIKGESYYNSQEINSFNHAISIVGWDDDYDANNFRTVPSRNGAWLIKNSWGTGFGNEGYFWISYDEYSLGAVYSYEFEPKNNQETYQYDGTTNAFNYFISDKTDTYANEFLVKGTNEVLNAVTIGNNTPNVPYKLEIYTNLTDTNNPTSGNCILTKNGTLENRGINYIKLDSSISLQNSTYYSIVFTLIGTNQNNTSIMLDTTKKASDIEFIADHSNEYCFAKQYNTWLQLTDYTCRIKGITKQNVLKPIESITLNKTTLSLVKGNTETLQATINPSDTTDAKTLTWKSEDENIAKVDGNGKVTGVGTGTTNITVTTSNGKSAACKVTVVRQTPSVNYSTHVQDIGWQGYVKDGSTAGTTGQSKRLEAIRIKLSNNTSYNGTIQYQTHIQDIGWQGWKMNDDTSGTSGQSKRLEAIRIKLTDELAENYDIYYRVHSQEFGWLGWTKNGESAGTAGYSYRLEAIEVKLVEKGGKAPGSTERPYIQRYVSYQTHVQDIGWHGWKMKDDTSGTSGQSKRLEAIRIKLTDELAENYDIYYRVHAQEFGWLDWAKNGEESGTAGYSYRLEGIEIKLVEKDGKAPGSTERPYVQRYIGYKTHVQDYGWQGTKYDGQTSGTSGQCKRLEAIQISLSNPLYSGSIQYQTHVQDYGWQSWKADGQTSGTSGQCKRLEAIKIKLTGQMAEKYDIYYRVHAQDYGWLGWAKNGSSAGTEGMSKRLEAIEIKLIKKGGSAPGSTANSYYKK